jgi:ferredoxin-NADP reductase
VILFLRTREILPATPRARILRLDLAGQRFDYVAGQAVQVATNGHAARRPYSLATAPEDARRDDCLELLVGVDQNGAPGTHLSLAPGRVIDVEGPVGSFTFPADPIERRFIFIAGGTGIAPLRAMLHHALTVSDRQIGLFYSARTPDEFAYEHEFQALAREGRIELRQTVTRAADEAWTGARGRIGHSALEPLVHDPATLCFICGPPALVSGVTSLLQTLGMARARIRVEEWA